MVEVEAYRHDGSAAHLCNLWMGRDEGHMTDPNRAAFEKWWADDDRKTRDFYNPCGGQRSVASEIWQAAWTASREEMLRRMPSENERYRFANRVLLAIFGEDIEFTTDEIQSIGDEIFKQFRARLAGEDGE